MDSDKRQPLPFTSHHVPHYPIKPTFSNHVNRRPIQLHPSRAYSILSHSMLDLKVAIVTLTVVARRALHSTRCSLRVFDVCRLSTLAAYHLHSQVSRKVVR